MATSTLTNTSNTNDYSDFTFYELYNELDMEAKELTELCVNVEVMNQVNEAIPNYLSSSSSSFRATFQAELTNHFKPVDFQDLQCLAVLRHKIALVNLQRKLWYTYFQCATGLIKRDEQFQLPRQFHSTEPLPCIRSRQVISLIVTQHYNNIHNETEVTPNDYVNFLRKKIYDLDTKQGQYQFQFDLIKDCLDRSIVNAFIYKIDEYIQNNDYTNAIQLHFETRMALLKYNYLEKLLSFKYLQQKPTEEQIQLATTICHLTFEKQKTDQELNSYQLGFLHRKLPPPFNLLEDSPPFNMITFSSDSTEYEQLSKQYLAMIQHTKSEFLTFLNRAFELKKDKDDKKYNMAMVSLLSQQYMLSMNKQLTSSMLDLIDEREKNIVQCVKHIYSLKRNFFHTLQTIKMKNSEHVY